MADFEKAIREVLKNEGGNPWAGQSQTEQRGKIALCSDCFHDQGLRLNSERLGILDDSPCPNCGSTSGTKLTTELVQALAQLFFVWGTIRRSRYGAAPVVQFNNSQSTCISTSDWFEPDLRLIEKTINVGFFYYGPRLWMIGEIEPLKALQDPTTRPAILERIVTEYPELLFPDDETFYRLRKDLTQPKDFEEYDAPPRDLAGAGRLDSVGFPVLYGSQDLQVCVHECRVTAEDEVYMATLAPSRGLRLLDLTEVLQEDGTEFESLDIAVHMLFLAGKHSYEIARGIALAANKAGYDGLVYPSYFSLLRTGAMPFETAFGISPRKFPQFKHRERAKMIANIALFGRPIEDALVRVRCINRVVLSRVEYGIQFGPVGC